MMSYQNAGSALGGCAAQSNEGSVPAGPGLTTAADRVLAYVAGNLGDIVRSAETLAEALSPAPPIKGGAVDRVAPSNVVDKVFAAGDLLQEHIGRLSMALARIDRVVFS